MLEEDSDEERIDLSTTDHTTVWADTREEHGLAELADLGHIVVVVAGRFWEVTPLSSKTLQLDLLFDTANISKT